MNIDRHIARISADVIQPFTFLDWEQQVINGEIRNLYKLQVENGSSKWQPWVDFVHFYYEDEMGDYIEVYNTDTSTKNKSYLLYEGEAAYDTFELESSESDYVTYKIEYNYPQLDALNVEYISNFGTTEKFIEFDYSASYTSRYFEGYNLIFGILKPGIEADSFIIKRDDYLEEVVKNFLIYRVVSFPDDDINTTYRLELTDEEIELLNITYNTSFVNNLQAAVIANYYSSGNANYSYREKYEGNTSYTNCHGDFYSVCVRDIKYNIAKQAPKATGIVKDTNPDTITITGNDNYVILKYSNLYYKVEAEVFNNATITDFSVKCGSQTSYNLEDTFINPEEGKVVVKITDSRGLTGTTTIFPTSIVNYFDLTCGLTVEPLTLEGVINFVISGKAFNSNLGETANSIKVKYRIREDGNNYSDWIVEDAKFNGSSYKYENAIAYKIENFDYTKAYYLEVGATDIFNEIYLDEYVLKSLPVFDWSAEDFNLNVPLIFNNGKASIEIDTNNKLKIKNEGEITISGDNVNIYTDTENINIEKVIGVCNAFTNSATNVTITSTPNTDLYSSLQALSPKIYGNHLCFQFSASRNTNTGTGNISNEIVGNMFVKAGGKIKDMPKITFQSDDLTLASFVITNVKTYSLTDTSVDEELRGGVSFDIQLRSTATATKTFMAFVAIPFVIDYKGYIG